MYSIFCSLAFNSADSEQQEGLFGELKSFYGLGSGKGFEETLLDE
jgi:hypothetical protein